MAAKTRDEAFTDDERAALKERAAEIKKARSRGTGSKKAEADAKDCHDTIAAMPDDERAIGEALQEIVSAQAPDLMARTWYGMPAWTRDGNVVVFFKYASKFKMRYSEVGFQEDANLDDGDMWPTVFAVTSASPAVRKKLTALVKNAVS